MKNEHMNPVDVGAPHLIPAGNLSDNPGSYAGMRRCLDAAQKGVINTRSTAHPGFIPGYYGDGLEALKGEWQTTTIK